MNKRSQTPIEFMIIFVFIIGIMSLFMVIVGVYTQDLTKSETRVEIDNFAKSITSEFEVLQNVEGGFKREVIIPSNTLDKYNVTIIDNYLYIQDLYSGGTQDENSHFYELSGNYNYIVTEEENGDLHILLTTDDVNNFDNLNLDTPQPPLSSISFLVDEIIMNNYTIEYMQDFNLTWASINILSNCVASEDWGGIKSISGSELIIDSKTNKTFTLTCNGIANDASNSFNLFVNEPLGSTLTFYTSPSVIAYNSSTNLSWEAQNMYDISNCFASGNWSGTKDISGLEMTGNLIENKTYTLTCNAPAGTVVETAFVEVLQLPEITFYPNESSIEIGENTNLIWNVKDATSCVASGDWNGERNVSGIFNTGDLEDEGVYSYTLSCSGPGGNKESSFSITVENPSFFEVPSCKFTGEVYSSSGIYLFTVPENCYKIEVHIWGAGGGGGACCNFGLDPSEGGKYINGSISVTPGETFSIQVGGGGEAGGWNLPSVGIGGFGGGGDGFVGGYADWGAGGCGNDGVNGGGHGGCGAADDIGGGGGGGASYFKRDSSGQTLAIAAGGSGGGGNGVTRYPRYGTSLVTNDWFESVQDSSTNKYLPNGYAYGGTARGTPTSTGGSGYVIIRNPNPSGFIISENTYNFNLANELKNPSWPVNVTVLINESVTISSTSTSIPAFSTGNLPEDSVVTIINNGRIQGAGGKGGNGGTIGSRPGKAGENGGNAIEITVTTTFNNTYGLIFGGAGGGGGGDFDTGNGNDNGGTGGGGGGAGINLGLGGSYGAGTGYSTNGGNGLPGTQDLGGAGGSWGDDLGGGGDGGAGGYGGNPGQNGQRGYGFRYQGGRYGGGLGGIAGYSVQTNGNTLTWIEQGDLRGPIN